MSIRHRPDLEERGSLLIRSMVVLVLVGVGLGLVSNAVLLAAGSKRGIAWVRTEKKLQSLEELSGSPAVENRAAKPAPEASAPSAPAPETVAPPAVTPPATTPMSTTKKPASTTKPKASTSSATTPSKPAQSPPVEKPAPATTDSAAKASSSNLPTVPDSRDPIEAKMPMVKQFHDANAALFVDAREAAEYKEGHIAGAVSLPFDEAFKDPKKLQTIDPKGKPIIIYCDGGDCEASKNLAYSLLDAGRKKVVVFTDGFPAWKAAGYPVATGTEPGAAK